MRDRGVRSSVDKFRRPGGGDKSDPLLAGSGDKSGFPDFGGGDKSDELKGIWGNTRRNACQCSTCCQCGSDRGAARFELLPVRGWASRERCPTCCRRGSGGKDERNGVLIASRLVKVVVRFYRDPSPSGDPAACGNDVQDLLDHVIRVTEV